MKLLLCLSLFFIFSCSHRLANQAQISRNQATTTNFLYSDPSGQYLLQRDLIEKKNKIQLRQKLMNLNGSGGPLEKNISISEIGSSKKKNNLIIRPVISQFSIWFEKQRYFSQFKLNKKTKKLDLIMKSPKPQWNRSLSNNVVSERIFCWFSQIPECIRRAGFLDGKGNRPKAFTVIWDNFPYYTEQYQNVPAKIFSKAVVKYDGIFRGYFKYSVQLSNQIIVYHFDKNLNFIKMFWISQGISVVKN